MRPRIHYTESQKALMWERWQKGESLQQIAQLFDRNHSSIQLILAATGGIRPAPRCRSRLALTLAEREEISRAVVAGHCLRSIAAQLGRAPSTISREIKRNGGQACYRASQAEESAWDRGRRPKTGKLVANRALAQALTTVAGINRITPYFDPLNIVAACSSGADPTLAEDNGHNFNDKYGANSWGTHPYGLKDPSAKIGLRHWIGLDETTSNTLKHNAESAYEAADKQLKGTEGAINSLEGEVTDINKKLTDTSLSQKERKMLETQLAQKQAAIKELKKRADEQRAEAKKKKENAEADPNDKGKPKGGQKEASEQPKPSGQSGQRSSQE
jgi:Helix-turn-helix domain